MTKVNCFDDLNKTIHFITSTADVTSSPVSKLCCVHQTLAPHPEALIIDATIYYSHTTYLDINELDLRCAKSVEDGVLTGLALPTLGRLHELAEIRV